MSHKNKVIVPFAAKWMDLEGIRLSEVSRPEKDKTVLLKCKIFLKLNLKK